MMGRKRKKSAEKGRSKDLDSEIKKMERQRDEGGGDIEIKEEGRGGEECVIRLDDHIH